MDAYNHLAYVYKTKELEKLHWKHTKSTYNSNVLGVNYNNIFITMVYIAWYATLKGQVLSAKVGLLATYGYRIPSNLGVKIYIFHN